MQEPLDQLTTYMKGASVNTLTSRFAGELADGARVRRGHEDPVGRPDDAATVLAAFKAAKDIPMNGIIKPWTPSAYVSAGSFSSIFANVSNPWMYSITYDGSEHLDEPDGCVQHLRRPARHDDRRPAPEPSLTSTETGRRSAGVAPADVDRSGTQVKEGH